MDMSHRQMIMGHRNFSQVSSLCRHPLALDDGIMDNNPDETHQFLIDTAINLRTPLPAGCSHAITHHPRRASDGLRRDRVALQIHFSCCEKIQGNNEILPLPALKSFSTSSSCFNVLLFFCCPPEHRCDCC